MAQSSYVAAMVEPFGPRTSTSEICNRLRLRRGRDAARPRQRGWAVSVDRVVELARAYGLPTRLDELARLRSDLIKLKRSDARR